MKPQFLIILQLAVLSNIHCSTFSYKNFGNVQKVSQVDRYPLPRDFLLQYVRSKKPLLMIGAVKDMTAVKTWNKDFLIKQATHDKQQYPSVNNESLVLLHDDRNKSLEARSLHLLSALYEADALVHIESTLPKFLRKDVDVPFPLTCSNTLANIVDLNLWYGNNYVSGQVVHHNYDMLQCVVTGAMTYVLADPKYLADNFWEEADAHDAPLNLESFDEKKFPSLKNVTFITATANAGDCLYIPFYWLNQYNSLANTATVDFSMRREFMFGRDQASWQCPETESSQKILASDVIKLPIGLFLLRNDIYEELFGKEMMDKYTKQDLKDHLLEEISVLDLAEQEFDLINQMADLMDHDEDNNVLAVDILALPEKNLKELRPLFSSYRLLSEKAKSAHETQHDEL